MGIHIEVTRDEVELLATLEVAKTLAFFGLLAAFRALGGDQQARLENLEQSLKSYFSGAEMDLPAEEATKFRRHASNLIDELLARVRIDDQPLKPGRAEN